VQKKTRRPYRCKRTSLLKRFDKISSEKVKYERKIRRQWKKVIDVGTNKRERWQKSNDQLIGDAVFVFQRREKINTKENM
jgi:hypothetical protein